MQGKRFRTKHLEVRLLASPLLHPRVGFVIPKYSYSAVQRNSLKRKLREIVRTEVLPMLLPVDLIIRVKPDAYGARFSELKDELMAALIHVERLLS